MTGLYVMTNSNGCADILMLAFGMEEHLRCIGLCLYVLSVAEYNSYYDNSWLRFDVVISDFAM